MSAQQLEADLQFCIYVNYIKSIVYILLNINLSILATEN